MASAPDGDLDASPAAEVGPDAAPPPPPAAPVTPESFPGALMVVGERALIASDRAIQARLSAQIAVDLRVQTEATAANARGKALVVITSSVMVKGLDPAFGSVTVPMIVLEPNLMGQLMFTAPGRTEHGATGRTETQLTITDEGHPLAADLIGTVTVYKTPWRLAWGVPGPEAVSVASVAGDPRRKVIFAYAAGAHMVGGATAAAKRLAFFLHDNRTENLTPQALALLDAAIAWMIR